ncbi:MAG: EAL domain-containing protein [Burkholderiales bacterium]|nr:EAL domain-containing protein [Burkholderiales bacterium]
MTAATKFAEELRACRQRFDALVEFSSDWYWEQDCNFRFTLITRNSGTEERFPVAQSLGKTRWELPYIGVTDEEWQQHRALLNTHQPFYDFVVKHYDAHQNLRFSSISGVPIFDAQSRFCGYRGIGKDVTQHKRAEQREAMEHAITRLLTDSADPGDVMKRILQAICEISGWDYGSYSNLGAKNQVMLRIDVWCSPSIDATEFMAGSGQRRAGDPKSARSGMRRRSWEKAAPIWIADITRDPTFRRAAVAAKIGLHAAFAFPIFVNGVVCGVMEFYSREIRQQDDLLLRSVKVIGNQIGQFYQRKRVEARQAMEHVVTHLLAESATTAETMPKIIQTICETLGWDYGAYWSLNEQSRSVSCIATWHVPSLDGAADFVNYVRSKQFDVDILKTPKKDGGFMRRIWTNGEPIWVHDIEADTASKRALIAAKIGLRSVFAFPIWIGQKIIGAMEFFSHDIRQPDEILIETAHSIGIQIGQFCLRKQAEERIQYLAFYDGLTGLPNRMLFSQRLNHSLAQARRYKKMLAVLFLDLDRFKNINDTLGHEAGDRLLQGMAQRLSGCLREGDTAARFGGDEFVVLLEDIADFEQAANVARKLIRAAQSPFIIMGAEFHITASIGISVYPEDGEDSQMLMKHADIAMYLAKDRGKNNYQFYSAHSNAHSIERLALESSLRHAVDRKEFVLHYQPKVDLQTGRVSGVEALLRWMHPDFGIISPALFIPLAEETGLIVAIGRWVLNTACAQNKAWQEQGLPELCISVNLSARQFNDEGLLSDVAQALAASGLAPHLLELEITESMVMHNADNAVKLLTEMKAMGVSIAIDDFGMGYSSLSQLKRFPINTIKVDRSFIKDLMANKEDAAITRAIIALGKSLNLNVIAEGVETRDQVGFLHKYQCDEMQGYYFSKPVCESEFAKLLRAGKVLVRLN